MVCIIGKKGRQLLVYAIIIAAIIAVAVYNWPVRETAVDKPNAIQVVKTVYDEPVDKADFFTEYRLERDKLRSEYSELLRERLKNADTAALRQQLQENVLQMVRERQREMEMESLIKAKGFVDVLVFYRDKSVSAVVKSSSLTREEVMQVADVISRMTDAKQEDIIISAKP